MNILSVKNLFCGYSNNTIIKNISFDVKEGEFLGIIGPNGSGKTTLFRAISGILKPFEGEIRYKNYLINKVSSLFLAREVAVIPQLLEIPYSFEVEEFILMGRFPHNGRFQRFSKKDYEILESVVNLTDIASIRNRKMSELSGGERQRVIIAQGFIQEPRMMLLDEPTSHLDITHQIKILDLLKHLNKNNNLTVIIVLHDLNLASNYCDRLILLQDGKIFNTGSPAEVLTYQNIEKVYNTMVIVKENPLNYKPYVFLISKHENYYREER
jgi:iron complex transport system ATP-binding protein